MFRTRDLSLFILVIFFLGLAITTTVVRDAGDVVFNKTVSFMDTDSSRSATSVDNSIDRQSNIDRLREKIANTSEQIKAVASVEAPEVSENIATNAAGVQKCLYPDDALSMVPKWPLTNVVVSVREGARVIYMEETSVVPGVSPDIASSTPLEEVVTTTIALIQLPLVPLKQEKVSCVPSEVVGVTNGGVLMFNGDVNSYRKIPENALIGYARDGFPIYGVYEGEVDACGGYDNPAGYRYTISTQRDYIVGCYVGTSQKFSL